MLRGWVEQGSRRDRGRLDDWSSKVRGEFEEGSRMLRGWLEQGSRRDPGRLDDDDDDDAIN